MDNQLSESYKSLMDSIETISNRSISIETKSQEMIEKLHKTKIDLMDEIYNPAFNIIEENQEEKTI